MTTTILKKEHLVLESSYKHRWPLRTETKLMMGLAGVSTPDVVIIDGERFLVVRVTPWQNLAHTKHYEALVVRENIDAN